MDLLVRYNTAEQARFNIEHQGADFADYEAEHRIYQQAVETAQTTLRRYGRVLRLDRQLLPNPSRSTQAEMVFGKITSHAPLSIVSQMRGYGVIFSDGIESDDLEFNAGVTATIGVAERFGQLVM